MLILSGLNENGETIIFDYQIGLITPSEQLTYSFLYEDTLTTIDTIRVLFPSELNGDTLNQILAAENAYVHTLTITLLWNAEEDLDLNFMC